VNETDRALSLVRATRRRLEAMRLLRGASRGALVACGVGLVLLLLEKASVQTLMPAGLAWWLALAGALAGVAATLVRPAIPVAVAALYLDERCATEERFVTLWSLPDDPHAAGWARGVAHVARVPRTALPREVGFVPVALFLLFGAGLLPTAAAASPTEIARLIDADAEAAPSTDAAVDAGRRVEDAARTLRERRKPNREALDGLERAIDHAFVRPEDRKAARVELAKARAGDGAARERLAQGLLKGGLLKGAGALADSDSAARSTASPAAGDASEGATPSPYRDEAAFLRAYDVEVSRLTGRGK